MQLSVVSTIYKSETFLEGFILEIIDAIKEIQITNYEIVFVLDGITDNSKEFLLNKKKEIPQIKIIELSRNFGHHYAVLSGLRYAKGELVFLIDCDLEVSPSVLISFKDIIDAKNVDVVYGVQKTRKGSFIERELGRFFWKLFNLLSDTKVPINVVTERLMKREYKNALISLGDKNIFLGGMMYWVGFNQYGVEIEKKKRNEKSTYSLSKRVSLLFEAITSFSEKPIKIVFNAGIVVSSLSFCISILLFYPETILLGFTSLMVMLLLLLGVVLLAVGIVGIYLARVFKQVQNRPEYVIKSIID
jgi:putative glycosyltransferase